MRALLNLVRDNEAAVQDDLVSCEYLLQEASKNLTILDLELGEEELVKSVAFEVATLTAFMAENSQRQ